MSLALRNCVWGVHCDLLFHIWYCWSPRWRSWWCVSS